MGQQQQAKGANAAAADFTPLYMAAQSPEGVPGLLEYGNFVKPGNFQVKHACLCVDCPRDPERIVFRELKFMLWGNMRVCLKLAHSQKDVFVLSA